MDSNLTNFPWPILPEQQMPPQWIGNGFRSGELGHRVLSYEVAQSHWSPELTQLHESEAGSHHPIDQASRRFALRSLARWLVPHHKNNKKPIVLDVGCSSGFVLDEIRHQFLNITLLGSDYLLQPLLGLAERLPNIPLLQFDLRQCPLPDCCVNAVTALNVLEHIDEDTRALQHIWRILQRDGIAHIEVPAGPKLYDVYDEQLMHHRRYRLKDLTSKAQSVGFKVLHATHIGFLSFPLFAFVKLKNRRLLSLPIEEKQSLVAKQIKRTSKSRLLDIILRAEEKMDEYVSYPFGIRCLVVLQKS